MIKARNYLNLLSTIYWELIDMKKENAEYFTYDNKLIFWQNGTSEEKIDPKKGWDKTFSHYGMAHRIANNFNKTMGYIKDNKPNESASVNSYESLWGSYRWGHSDRLCYELKMYPAGFSIDLFYHDAREEKRTGDGRYDNNKLKRMTYHERLELKKSFKTLSLLIEKEGVIYAESKVERKGWDFIDFKINKDPDRHWGHAESYHNEEYHKRHNARDKDKKLLLNGQTKWFRNRKGFLQYGKVYHNINNLWWCLLPSGEIRNHGCFHYFDITPKILKVRKLSSGDSSKKEKAKRILNENISNAVKDFEKNGINQDLKSKIERVYDLFDTSFIAGKTELILHKKWNIYFRIDNVFSNNDFDYKLLSYCSFYCADNHFKKTSVKCKYIWNRLNRWLKKDFTYKELQIIYQKLGGGANRNLGNDFIKSGLNMEVLSV